MNTILGASGQVGSAVVANLLKNRQPVKGIIRNEKKAARLKKAGATVALADIHDESALTASFRDATALLVYNHFASHLHPVKQSARSTIGFPLTAYSNYTTKVYPDSRLPLVTLSQTAGDSSAFRFVM